MSYRNSYAGTHPLRGIVVNLLLLTALVLLAIGLWAPIMRLEKFYVFANVVSVLSALNDLALEGEWGLFLLIGLFSVVFPVAKLLMLFVIWNLERADSAPHRRHLDWLARYGKWSMLDVFVVALLVVSVKLGALAQVEVGYGIYAFAASVILTMVLSGWIGHRAHNGVGSG